MSYDGIPLTLRQAVAFVLMRVGFVGYCGAWVGGFVWWAS